MSKIPTFTIPSKSGLFRLSTGPGFSKAGMQDSRLLQVLITYPDAKQLGELMLAVVRAFSVSLRIRLCVVLSMYIILISSFTFCGAAWNETDALDALVQAYPDFLKGHDNNRLFWNDGTIPLVRDAEAKKTFEQRVKRASILDQFHLEYPTGSLVKSPDVNEDPDRFRNEAFFQKMYGDCRNGSVDAHMTTIIWLPKTWGKKIKVTNVNNVAGQLTLVSDEIDNLPAALKSAAYPIAGVLSCRPVADTGKMSMHSYGAAIDLNLQYSDYWFWQKNSESVVYRNRMPQQIVDIFERHGFIWGGKWYHFDTMHFEYRPELFSRAKQ